MPFSPKTKKDAFIASGGKCSICHVHPIMNYHHINPEAQSQDNSYNNCLPVCSNCHEFIMTGEITREDQKINRNTWYRNIDWKSSNGEKGLLDRGYQDNITLQSIEKNLTDIRTKFDEYITGIHDERDPKIVSDTASKLATSILATGSTYTFLQLDKGETVSGYPCPQCKRLIDFKYVDNNIIRCPKCGGSIEPWLQKEDRETFQIIFDPELKGELYPDEDGVLRCRVNFFSKKGSIAITKIWQHDGGYGPTRMKILDGNTKQEMDGGWEKPNLFIVKENELKGLFLIFSRKEPWYDPSNVDTVGIKIETSEGTIIRKFNIRWRI